MISYGTKKVIDKGFYNHTQNNDSVHLKQYIITGEGDKKCLLLRFLNITNLYIKGLEIVLTQYGFGGKILESAVVHLDKVSARPQDTFTAKCGIILDDKCTDFTVDVIGFLSGGYKYRESNGRMIPHYDPKPEKKDRPKRYGRMTVVVRKPALGRLSALIAVITLIIFGVICVSSSVSLFGKF